MGSLPLAYLNEPHPLSFQFAENIVEDYLWCSDGSEIVLRRQKH